MSNPFNPESDLPSGKELVSFCEDLLRGSSLNAGSPSEAQPAQLSDPHPVTDRRLEQQLLKERAVGIYRNRFFEGLKGFDLRDYLKEHGERKAANELRGYFDRNRLSEMRRLSQNGTQGFVIQAVGEVTMKYLAGYAKQQAEDLQKRAGAAVPNSPEQLDYQHWADWWTPLADVLGRASDPDKS